MSKLKLSVLENIIFSMTKAEKRFFKLSVSSTISGKTSKFLALFDYVDKKKFFEEEDFLKKHPAVKRQQIPNLKNHLYKQIMKSLRSLNSTDDMDLMIRNHMDNCTLLYNKCLYHQSLKELTKAKKLAEQGDKTLLLLHILEQEKKLALKLIRPDIEKQVSHLSEESEALQKHIGQVFQFSNLFHQVYAHYVSSGYIRNAEEFEEIKKSFEENIPAYEEENLSSDEKMYLYSTIVSYRYFIQDFKNGLHYAEKWYQLFEESPNYILPKIETYIRAVNNLALGYFSLRKYEDFANCLGKLEAIKNTLEKSLTENLKIQLFKHLSTHRLNHFFLKGKFTEGVKIIPEIASQLETYVGKMDSHHVMIFYYKFASMYFGAGEYRNAIKWLNLIINNSSVDLRSDIQGFARILNLISHYELENLDMIDYHIRSTYRFLINIKDMNLFQRKIMQFLRRLSYTRPDQIKERFVDLKSEMEALKKVPYESRAFAYFDMISWLESKIRRKSIQEIIRGKYLGALGRKKEE